MTDGDEVAQECLRHLPALLRPRPCPPTPGEPDNRQDPVAE